MTANSNGNRLVKAFGIAGLVIGVLGGAFGLAAQLGPGRQVAEHTAALKTVDDRLRMSERSIAVIESQLTMILDTVREIKAVIK